MDRFPQFLSTIRAEFPDDCEAIANEIVEAELGDFCWESRFAECPLGPVEYGFDDDAGPCMEVAILGYFRERYLVATCIVDAQQRLRAMLRVRYYDELDDAESIFLAMD
jgi:hypothetical protein